MINAAPAPAKAPVSSGPRIFKIETLSLKSQQPFGSSAEFTWYVSFKKPAPGEIRAAIASGRLGGHWHPVLVPGNMSAIQSIRKRAMQAWFFRAFRVSDKSSHTSVRLGIVTDRDVTYWNGIRIGSTGRWDSKFAEAYDAERVYPVPSEIIKLNSINYVLIHAQAYFPEEIGPARGTMEIGPARAVFFDFLMGHAVEMIFLICYITVASYFLFLFIRRRADRENLIFAFFLYALVAYQGIKSPLRFLWEIDFIAYKTTEYAFLFCSYPAFFYFIRTYYKFERTRFMRYFDY